MSKHNSVSADFVSIFGADDDPSSSSSNALHRFHMLSNANRSATDANSHNTDGNNNNNITPNILLEQLAYVDNFMPSLEQDFNSFGSWLNADSTDSGNADQEHTTDGGDTMGLWEMDERLAIELSAFADESFIFPDEEGKLRNFKDKGSNNNDDDDKKAEEPKPKESSKEKDSHYLTQRRNTFLKSQYDNSKSRCASKYKENKVPIEERSLKDDLEDDEFVNLEPAVMPSAVLPSRYAPHQPSPLINHFGGSSSESTTPTSLSSSNASSVSPNIQIEMPDYSSIPTSTLLSLLPKVRVPKGAYHSLSSAGLKAEQIDSLAVLIAHYEQQKSNFKLKSIALPSYQDIDPSYIIDLLTDKPKVVSLQKPEKKSQTNISAFPTQDTDFLKLLSKFPDVKDDSKNRIVKQAGSTANKSRQKRKLKEKELESSVHELSELALSLQQRIHTLEMENKVLKNLVVNSGELDSPDKFDTIKRTLLGKAHDKDSSIPHKPKV